MHYVHCLLFFHTLSRSSHRESKCINVLWWNSQRTNLYSGRNSGMNLVTNTEWSSSRTWKGDGSLNEIERNHRPNGVIATTEKLKIKMGATSDMLFSHRHDIAIWTLINNSNITMTSHSDKLYYYKKPFTKTTDIQIRS